MMLEKFELQIPTKIVFGVGVIESIGKETSKLGKSALIVSSKSAIQYGIINKISKLLNYENIKSTSLCISSGEPGIDHVNQIKDFASQIDFDVIIGVGGGSVIDAVKASSFTLSQNVSIEDALLENNYVITKAIPIIAVPTIPGSGSEVSKGAIISWKEKQIKKGLRGEKLYPKTAIIDPYLVMSVPKSQIRISGFDIFTHAVETYISKKANIFTENLSKLAINIILKHLPKIINDKMEIENLVMISYASAIMGINLGNSSTCLPHRLQYPVGILTNTSHAVGLASLYPAWIAITKSASIKKFNNLEKTLNSTIHNNNGNSKPIEEVLSAFMRIINMNIKLSDLGVGSEQCDHLAAQVTGALDNDPWWSNDKDISLIYKKALEA